MAYSTQSAVSDGTLDVLGISIKYFDAADITVYFDNVAQIVGTTWDWSSPAEIAFTPVVADGVAVLVKRSTPLDAPRHQFNTPGSAPWNKRTVDENFQQTLYTAQEAQEGSINEYNNDVDARGFRIKNVGNAIDGGDAVNLQQLRNTAFGNGLADPQTFYTTVFTCLEGQTDFVVTNVPGKTIVVLNGSTLTYSEDYTSDGTKITLTFPATAGHSLAVNAFIVFDVAGAVPLVDLISSDPAKGASLVGVGGGRTQADKNAEVVSVADFSGASSAIKILNALTYLDENGGGTLRINRGAQLTIDETILKLLENDIEIIFEPGAKLIAAAGLASPVIDLRASSSTITERIARILNPRIDCSAGLTQNPGQGCTAISAQYFKQLIIENVSLYGGELRTNTNADSGVTPIACDYVKITGGRIRGFSDGGVYIGGDNTSGIIGNGITAIISGVLFERCNNAVLAKRDLNHLLFTGNYVDECGSGVIPAEVTVPNYTNPAYRLDITHNRFHKCLANIARFRGPTKGKFIGNTVEDWGFDPDGASNPAGANGYALSIQGASGIEVKSNEFKLKDWTLNDQRAYLLDNVTLDSVLFTQGSHSFSNNSYRNIPRVHVEVAGGTASDFLNEHYEGITTGKFSGMHSGSLVTFKENTKRGIWSRMNGIEQPLGSAGIVSSPIDLVLTANDAGTSYNNAGATALVTFTLPAANPGVEFEFTCMDADGLRIQLTTSDLLRTGAGNTTNNGTATSTTVGATVRIMAVDTTNWIAKSITGTWTLA